MIWIWGRVRELENKYTDLKKQYDNLMKEYENYKNITDRSIRDYQNKIERLELEKKELEKSTESNIIEKNIGNVYESGVNYATELLNRESNRKRGATIDYGSPTQFPILDGIPTSYNEFNLMQMQLFDIWSRAVDIATGFRIQFCDRIERDIGINLEKVKNAYRIAGDYVKKLLYSPEIYNLLASGLKPTKFRTTIYSPYYTSYSPRSTGDDNISAKNIDALRNLCNNLGIN